ncbi:MAG: transposase [Actinobacteria bacterium]|nr:transposase [Actinomycetota bacterium]
MPRIARVVAPGVPHHVTQRGNRRQRTFFNDDDYRAYIEIMAEWCDRSAVEIWAYCLMPNHVHFVAVPETTSGFSVVFRETHRRYSLRINRRNSWQGYLWQGRFFSFPMDDSHLLQAARYIELNPVRAGLVGRPEEYPWSSAAANIQNRADRLVARPSLPLIVAGDWSRFLDAEAENDIPLELAGILRKHERTGRPLGGDSFIQQLEQETGRMLRKGKPGPQGVTASRPW